MTANSMEWPEGSENFSKWTVGSRIISLKGEMDCGVMTWDANDFEVERHTRPDERGYIESVEFHEGQGWSHCVIFPESEVCVNIYGEELVGPDYEIEKLGNGFPFKPAMPNYYRDPEVVKQIRLKEELEGSQVKDFEVEAEVVVRFKVTVPARSERDAKMAVEKQYHFPLRELVQSALFENGIEAVKAASVEEV
ncbi:hypothetical protein [Pseudodesulfovibrio pelocollis]|uniref:hypothetical protein n=1 Tax=Pseudodesulfovibrio pelocollis TaxID=3051432 RepID=UPI00255B293B|nr:hypothetical protein [Pseudodesulfovibrio sp. SB368]